MSNLNLLNDIALYSYESNHIYRIYSAMPLLDLMKEYKVASVALSAFHENDLETSIVVEYLAGVVQIMCLVITERVSEFVKVEVLEDCI